MNCVDNIQHEYDFRKYPAWVPHRYWGNFINGAIQMALFLNGSVHGG